MPPKAPKTCFVICPIGDEGTDIRKRSNQVLNYILTPPLKERGFEPVRADKISEPGIISDQVINHLVEDRLVIADLTGHNPNVFYELAVRHAAHLPVIHLIQVGESIPFDVAPMRTILLDHTDLDLVERTKVELGQQIDAILKPDASWQTPISAARQFSALSQSNNPNDQAAVQIIRKLDDLTGRITNIERSVLRRSTTYPFVAGTTIADLLPTGGVHLGSEGSIIFDSRQVLPDEGRTPEAPA